MGEEGYVVRSIDLLGCASKDREERCGAAIKWKFSTDEVIHSVPMKFILKPSQNADMWQAMLSPLNCVHVALDGSKNLSLGDDIHQCLHFLLEYSCQQIMATL